MGLRPNLAGRETFGPQYKRAMQDDPANAAARARFTKFDRRETVFVLVAGPIAMALSYVALQYVARLRYRALPTAIYTLTPDDLSWLPLGLLCGASA